jgi:hypothetical protein
MSVLHIAVFLGRMDMMKLFLEAKVETGLKDDKGQTALHLAAFYGLTDVVKVLVDITLEDNEGRTALYLAAYFYRHGQGQFYGVASGRHYKGGFVNDREEGFTTVKCLANVSNTSATYTVNGQSHGRGHQLDVSISGLTKMYEGPWVNDRLFGYGRYSLGNIHVYYRKFIDGLFEGLGMCSNMILGTHLNVLLEGRNFIG